MYIYNVCWLHMWSEQHICQYRRSSFRYLSPIYFEFSRFSGGSKLLSSPQCTSPIMGWRCKDKKSFWKLHHCELIIFVLGSKNKHYFSNSIGSNWFKLRIDLKNSKKDRFEGELKATGMARRASGLRRNTNVREWNANVSWIIFRQWYSSWPILRSSRLFSAGKAAGAAIVFPARCHYWQRPLPISSPSAANGKGVAFFPLRRALVPIWRRLFPLIPSSVGKQEVFRVAWPFFVPNKLP